MKMIQIEGGFPAWQVEGLPLGIEQIDRGYWVAFRIWNRDRIYMRDHHPLGGERRFASRKGAEAYIKQIAAGYLANVIEEVRA